MLLFLQCAMFPLQKVTACLMNSLFLFSIGSYDKYHGDAAESKQTAITFTVAGPSLLSFIERLSSFDIECIIIQRFF